MDADAPDRFDTQHSFLSQNIAKGLHFVGKWVHFPSSPLKEIYDAWNLTRIVLLPPTLTIGKGKNNKINIRILQYALMKIECN